MQGSHKGNGHRKRIAMISEHASPLAALGSVDSGGQNVYVAHLARQLSRLGFMVDVFTRRDRAGLPEIFEWEPGVRVIHVPAGPAHFVPKEELMAHMGAFTDFFLAFMETHGDYDLIHANFWMSGMVAAEVKRQTGIPFAITFHALGRVRRIHQGQKDGFPDTRFEIEDQIVAEADRILAECPQDENDLLELYNADHAKIEIIPCGFDPQELWPLDKRSARQALGLDADERVVLQLGRMVPRKGVDNAVRGFAHMVKTHNLPGRLLIVGGEAEEPDPTVTPEIGRLQAIAAEEGIAELVTFVGRRDREVLKDYFSAADIFISTPWYEPFGITPVEAMACGTPVIGSNVGGIKYTISDGETGFLVPPNDPQALGDKLAYLYTHPQELERFSQQAITRANQLFTWKKVAQAVASVFEKLLEQPLAQPAREKPAVNGKTAAVNNHIPDPFGLIDRGFEDSIRTMQRARKMLGQPVIEAARAISTALSYGGKVLVCGNGGSAAEAQHFTAEFIGRFIVPGRRGLPFLALTADTAFLTAWSNDVDFDQVFARQVEAYGQPGDVLVGISTSGNSRNVIKAFKAARQLGMKTIAMLGGDGGQLLALADYAVVIPSSNTQNIQETQLVVLHLLSELIENQLTTDTSPARPGRLKTAFDAEASRPWSLKPAIPVSRLPRTE